MLLLINYGTLNEDIDEFCEGRMSERIYCYACFNLLPRCNFSLKNKVYISITNVIYYINEEKNFFERRITGEERHNGILQ